MQPVKKIAVFGGSGMTGLSVLEHALSQGLAVRALLRPSSVLPPELKDKIEIVLGDVTVAEDVKNTITGTDGVVVVLGTRNCLDATTVMSEGVKNVLSAMTSLGVKPISVCLSSFLLMSNIPLAFDEINKEHSRMLAAIEASTDKVDWIAVLPPHISDSPKSKYLVKEGALPGGRVVSKKDLAAFLIEALSQPEYYRKKMAISSSQ